MKKTAFVVLSIILMCVSGCRKQYALRGDYFIFGYEPADCFTKDCVHSYLLQNDRLFEDKLKQKGNKLTGEPKQMKYQAIRCDESDYKMANDLAGKFPAEIIKKTGRNIFGETGNDGGFYYVEIKTEGEVKKYYFTPYVSDKSMPAEVSPFAEQLINTTNTLMKN